MKKSNLVLTTYLVISFLAVLITVGVLAFT